MPSDTTDDLSEEDIERLVRTAVRRELSALVGKLVWTLLAGFALLVGLQFVQFWIAAPSGTASVVILAIGLLVCGSSLYLLALLYRRTPTG